MLHDQWKLGLPLEMQQPDGARTAALTCTVASPPPPSAHEMLWTSLRAVSAAALAGMPARRAAALQRPVRCRNVTVTLPPIRPGECVRWDHCVRPEADIVSDKLLSNRHAGGFPDCLMLLPLMSLVRAFAGRSTHSDGDLPVALDVGSNIGGCAMLMVASGWRVAAFEPVASNLRYLLATASQTPHLAARGLAVMPFGLGSAAASFVTVSQEGNHGNSQILNLARGTSAAVLVDDDAKGAVMKRNRGVAMVRRLDEVVLGDGAVTHAVKRAGGGAVTHAVKRAASAAPAHDGGVADGAVATSRAGATSWSAGATSWPPGSIGLMKVDVQGFEWHVLAGGRRLLASGAVGSLFFECEGRRLEMHSETARTLLDGGAVAAATLYGLVRGLGFALFTATGERVSDDPHGKMIGPCTAGGFGAVNLFALHEAVYDEQAQRAFARCLRAFATSGLMSLWTHNVTSRQPPCSIS